MLLIFDCDISSTLAKIDELEIITKIFPDDEFLIPYAVYLELKSAEEIGFNYLKNISMKLKTTVATLKDKEMMTFNEISTIPRIHKGEAESIAMAKCRNGIFLTNDEVAMKVATEQTVEILTLFDILRKIARERLMDKDKMEMILKKIEEEDNTILTWKDKIIETYEYRI